MIKYTSKREPSNGWVVGGLWGQVKGRLPGKGGRICVGWSWNGSELLRGREGGRFRFEEGA